MSNLGVFLLVVLGATLAVAVGYLVYQLGKLTYAMVQYRRRARFPVKRVQYSELGLMESDPTDACLWSGRVGAGSGKEIWFRLSGSSDGPDDRLARALTTILAKRTELGPPAVALLRERESSVRDIELDLCGIELIDLSATDRFTMEFTERGGDGSRSWIVAFSAGKPADAGFED